MTPNQINLVRTTFAQIVPMADTAASLFYARLFELDPSLRPLFTADLAEQGRKLMQTLAVAVHGLDDLEALAPTVRALGRRHASYGVQGRHYQTVAQALLDTLELCLGEALIPKAREAWAEVYWLLVAVMQQGAAESEPAPRLTAPTAPAVHHQSWEGDR
ncbi:MAG: globin family protein [Chloroflexota bacterium]